MKRLSPLALVALLASLPAFAADNDNDGIPNHLDNCIEIPDSQTVIGTQVDSDGDGYGNLCDADFNQDGIVGGPDLVIHRQAYQTQVFDPAVDSNSDGFIGLEDHTRIQMQMRGPPGPSAFNRPVPALPAVFGGVLAGGLLVGGWRRGSRRARQRSGAIVFALASLLGARAEAGGNLSFVWTATTGTGATGSSFIDAEPGDVLTGELRLYPDAGGVAFVSASIRFDSDLGDELDLVSVTGVQVQIVQAPFMYLQPLVFTPGSPASTSESTTGAGGEILACDARGSSLVDMDPANPTSGEWVLCEVQFEVTGNVATDGADLEVGFFYTGYDSIVGDDNALQTSLPAPVEAAVNGP